MPSAYGVYCGLYVAAPGALFDSARFTVQYVRSVGQDVSIGKCVVLSSSKAFRKCVKLWDVSGDGQPDIRDLGGHLDFTRRARAGTLSRRVKDATHGVVAVAALPLGFQVKQGLAGRLCLPILHAVEASYVSASSPCSLRAASVWSVCSSMMPLASTPVILHLLDGPVGVDPAYCIVWSRFRTMRRYLAHWPEEVPLFFFSYGAVGHGPVH